MRKPFLFLDFDGVICDSLEECYHSSYLAHAGVQVGSAIPGHGPDDNSYKAGFRACRPFVRSGEDYVVLHRLLAEGRLPQSQADFDAELKRIGRSALDELKSALYAVREAMLIHHKTLWMSWNPLYAGMSEVLKAISTDGDAYILSTKKPEFIAGILAHHGIDWPSGRILEAVMRSKLDIISGIASEESSILVDDQIDHLRFDDPWCMCYLAIWGYVNPALVTEKSPVLTLDDALRMISAWGRQDNDED